MIGKFPSTVIVLSSCAGLYSADLADALIDRGASAVVSWNVLVELSQTDEAIAFLLKELCVEQLNVKQSVETTMNQVGPDPKYGATLLYYPTEAWNLSIKNLKTTEALGFGLRFPTEDVKPNKPASSFSSTCFF